MTRGVVSAKNQPILLRRSFPLAGTGSKTGTGSLSVTAALGLTSGGTVTSPVIVKVARILTPLAKNRPQILLSVAGVGETPGPKTGDGALVASVSITGVSAARNFYDVGTGDALVVTAAVSGGVAVGVNRTGTGALTGRPALTVSAGVNRTGTGTLARVSTLAASGSISSPASSTGTGALAVSGVVTGAGAVQFYGGGTASVQSTLSATGTVARSSAGGALAASVAISGTGSTSVRWERLPEQSSVWTIIPRTTSST